MKLRRQGKKSRELLEVLVILLNLQRMPVQASGRCCEKQEAGCSAWWGRSKCLGQVTRPRGQLWTQNRRIIGLGINTDLGVGAANDGYSGHLQIRMSPQLSLSI